VEGATPAPATTETETVSAADETVAAPAVKHTE
jgi:hypothetical protein